MSKAGTCSRVCVLFAAPAERRAWEGRLLLRPTQNALVLQKLGVRLVLLDGYTKRKKIFTARTDLCTDRSFPHLASSLAVV